MKLYGIKGFTLVELAIVLTIIGLLIGGVLKGQELVKNARINATIAQVKAYQSAVVTFKDIYDWLPGDLANADARIPGCTLGCNSSISGWGRPADGSIGDRTWDGYMQTNGVTPGNAIGSEVGYEVFSFWMHLLKANLINGVQDAGIKQAVSYEFGVTHPKAKIGGGFMVGSVFEGYTTAPYLGIPPTANPTRGVMIILVPVPRISLQPTSYPYNHAINAVDAAQIDRKMDDGKPSTGVVRGSGDQTAPAPENRCYDASMTSAPLYTNAVKDVCKLIFEISS